MKHWKLAGSTAAIAILAGTGAFADVTPEEVWQNWQDMSASAGQTVTATSAERDGDTLVVEGVTISYEKDGTSFTSTIEQIDFADNGDGSVDVTTSDSYEMSLKAPAAAEIDGAMPTDLKITLTQPEMVVTASGTVDALSYEFEGPSVTAKFEPGDTAAEAQGSFEVALTDLSGKYLVEGDGEAKKITSDFAAKSLKLTGAGKDAAEKSDVTFSATIADLAGNSNGNFLGAAEMADMAKALQGGFALNGNFSHGAMTFDLARHRRRQADQDHRRLGRRRYVGGDGCHASAIRRGRQGAEPDDCQRRHSVPRAETRLSRSRVQHADASGQNRRACRFRRF